MQETEREGTRNNKRGKRKEREGRERWEKKKRQRGNKREKGESMREGLMKPDGSECGGCEAEFTVLQGYLGPGQGCHRRPSASLQHSSVRLIVLKKEMHKSQITILGLIGKNALAYCPQRHEKRNKKYRDKFDPSEYQGPTNFHYSLNYEENMGSFLL